MNIRLKRIHQKEKKLLKRRKISKNKKKIAIKNNNKKINKGLEMVIGIYKTIIHFFPNIFDELEKILDIRKKSKYTIAEIIFSAIAIAIFKQESRNAMNNEKKEGKFAKNYYKIFKLRLPHMDTVNKVLEFLKEETLELLKKRLIQILIEKKVFSKFNLSDVYYQIAIDATGVVSFKEPHCENCLYKESKKGKKTYFHNVLEAKIVCSNGFGISLGTEWLENPDEEYEKQDCELKAFKRLAEKIKKQFPRLPICILADGLYPNQTFFKICKDYGWKFIVTLKDGNLKSIWNEIEIDKLITPNKRKIFHKLENQNYTWLTDIEYQGFNLNWIQGHVEKLTKKRKKPNKEINFVFLTNILPDYFNIKELTDAGRRRSKIEDSFNTQKNRGYALTHKFNRRSYCAMKNFYSCLQIGYMINILFELGSLIKQLLDNKTTLKHLWKQLISALTYLDLNIDDIKPKSRFQVRFD